MIFVVAGTQDVIGDFLDDEDVSILACSRCGNSYTDRVIAQNTETGEDAAFQFEHYDYEKVTPEQHTDLIYQLETIPCQVCDDVLWPIEAREGVLTTKALVEKLLRQAPDGISLSHTCGKCTEAGLCPDCDDEDHDHE